ncbi:MAG TPA: septal ring lytic transglycosylase RlpA family protein [Solirubrobacteraceae bacterium]|nr:septal ring lytic transglycosylase RlpA family protein [Solirubrobacteraceae bacterium]
MLRRTRRPLACVPILCTLVAVPTAALARTPRGGNGGSGIGTSGGATTPTSTTPYSAATPGTLAPGVIALGGTLNASGDGISVTVAASGIQGHPVAIGGQAPVANAGGLIDIQAVRVGSTNWTQVATATIATNGSFSARWTPSSNGQMTLRAVLAPEITNDAATDSTGAAGLASSGGGSAAAATSQLSTSALTIPIFKNAVATLYGPGFWGRRTACGQRLTRATLGIASRTLTCGTEVAVLYRGRELTVPVIDRGPFGNRASWDLTTATARALGIRETVTIGTLSSATAPDFTAGS